MKCNDCKRSLYTLKEGELTDEIKKHLDACPSCRAVWNDVCHIDDHARNFQVSEPETMRRRAQAAFQTPKPSSVRPTLTEYLIMKRRQLGLAALATAAFGLALTLATHPAEAATLSWKKVQQKLLSVRNVRIMSYGYHKPLSEGGTKVSVTTWWIEGKKSRMYDGAFDVLSIDRGDGHVRNWSNGGASHNDVTNATSDNIILDHILPEIRDPQRKATTIVPATYAGRQAVQATFAYGSMEAVKKHGVWEESIYPTRITYILDPQTSLPLEEETFELIDGSWQPAEQSIYEYNQNFPAGLFDW